MSDTRATLPNLARNLISDVIQLFRQEFKLAQAESSAKLSSLQNGAISIIVGLLLAFSALLILLQAVVVGLSNMVEPWLASLIVGVAVALIALIFLKVGQSKLKPAYMIPERTIESIRTDRDMIKEHIHESAR